MNLSAWFFPRIISVFAIISLAAGVVSAKPPKEPEITTLAVEGTFDEGPTLRFRPKFEYPPVLADKKVEGEAEVVFRVEEGGHVTEARVTSAPHPYAGSCAMSTVSRMVFTPAMRDGKPVGFEARIRVRYSLK
jgi:TonB family protein